MNDPVAGLVVVGGTLICIGLAWCADRIEARVRPRGVAKTAVASGRSLGRAAAATRPLERFATPRGRTSRMVAAKSPGRSSHPAAPAHNPTLTAASVRDRRAPRTTALPASAEVHRGAVRQTASATLGQEARLAAQVSSPRRPSPSDGVRLTSDGGGAAGRWWGDRGGRLTTAEQLSGRYGLPGDRPHLQGASIPSRAPGPRRAVLLPESQRGAASWTAARGDSVSPRAVSCSPAALP
ncbi:MAG: hypothetical protein AB7U23_10000 [Dehalococcoidia bacterium]